MKRNVPVPVPPGSKWCFRCSQLLPLQSFSIDRRKADGRAYGCRKCLRAKQRERRLIQALDAALYERFAA
jgi:hypothetical protein